MWTENLSVQNLVESSDTVSHGAAEQEISATMNEMLLNNEDTAKISYNLSANDSKDLFTISLRNINWSKWSIELSGNHDTVFAVNTFISEAILGNDTFINPLDMWSYTSTEVALLQDEIHQILAKVK